MDLCDAVIMPVYKFVVVFFFFESCKSVSNDPKNIRTPTEFVLRSTVRVEF